MGKLRSRVPSRPSGDSGPPRAPRTRKPSASTSDNQASQPGHSRKASLEHDADARAQRVLHGDSDGASSSKPARASMDAGSGRPLNAANQALAQATLGENAGQVRVHDDRASQLTAASMQARAFADGTDIWLGPGESEHDRELMAHELAHVAQGEPGVHPRSATWLERRAWLSFFDHYLPRRFLNNYMDDTGTPITLTTQEMIDVNPIVNLRASQGFATELGALQAQVKASKQAGAPAPAVKYIDETGPGQAMTNGTLGNFTIHYRGMLTVSADGTWVFVGTMDFYDIWDFDPKPFGTSGRSVAGELKTRVAADFLPGRSFEIFSTHSVCAQTGTDRAAVWAGGTPQRMPDQAGRAGADIEVGAAGGVATGPAGEVAGGEVGAQSAEDLNP